MPPAESIIESAIENLKSSPGKFQRLVEHYARLTYPDRFKNLIPQGRTPNDVTVKGWPDIYSLSPDERLDVAEATHSPEWPRHLEEDVEKAEALGAGGLSGFLFVAWDGEPSPLTDQRKSNPRYEKLVSLRRRLTALGIPAENVNFVFKKQLVHALAQPRFALTLKEVLGLPNHSLPFRLIRQIPQIFGRVGSLDVFAPAKEEYRLNLVHHPAIRREVESRLEGDDYALILGRGATGKTVLAIQIALSYEDESYPAYYLDLAKGDFSFGEALDAITTRADDRVLFIVDNVHLNEEAAGGLFEHWRAASAGSRLLLLGRDSTAGDSRGVACPLDDLKKQALVLSVGPGDLAGVLRRLMQRIVGPGIAPPEPPDEVLQGWQKLFGGDLIAFSAAVARRGGPLSYGNWQLQPQDADEYIQEHYFEKYAEAKPSLLTLAALAHLEVDAPQEAIDLAKLRPLLREGLVHRSKYGRQGQFEYYHLVHPGIGSLLLRAAGYSPDELPRYVSQQLHYVAKRKPFSGTLMAARLDSVGRGREAAEIYKTVIESGDEGVAILFRAEMQGLRFIYERLMRLRLFAETELDELLAGNSAFIDRVILGSGIDNLTFYLTFSQHNLPFLYRALNARLAEPEVVKALSRKACTVPVDSLIGFLRTATVGPAVVSAIDQEEWDINRSSRTFGGPNFLPKLARMFKRLGRVRLAETYARAIINNSGTKDWQRPNVDLYHLGYVLRLGRSAGEEAVTRLLTDVIRPAWLKEKYMRNAPSAIASTLFNVWRYYDGSVMEHFRVEELRARVEEEIRYLNIHTAKYLHELLEFLGCAALVGVSLDEMRVEWPSARQVNGAVRAVATRDGQEKIQDYQILLWIGLRVMARQRRTDVKVESSLGQQVLDLWKYSPGYTHKQRALNEWMINWLELCGRGGWVLIPDPSPFVEPTFPPQGPRM